MERIWVGIYIHYYIIPMLKSERQLWAAAVFAHTRENFFGLEWLREKSSPSPPPCVWQGAASNMYAIHVSTLSKSWGAVFKNFFFASFSFVCQTTQGLYNIYMHLLRIMTSWLFAPIFPRNSNGALHINCLPLHWHKKKLFNNENKSFFVIDSAT